MVVNTRIKFTYEDYKNLPDSETKRYELIEGELIMVPSPTIYHQRISINLLSMLMDYVKKHDLGYLFYAPCDVVLSQKDVVQPDIFFIAKKRSQIMIEAYIREAPDLVIEILSPATADKDKTVKRKLYARHGVKEYWLVEPGDKTIEVLVPGKRGFQSAGLYKNKLASPLFPGLDIDLSQVFPG